MEYFIENTPLTSLPIIDSNYVKTRYFYYKGRDFLSSLGIFNTNFKSIDIEFPTRSIAPQVTYFPAATGSKYRFFDFGGTQNLYVSGNSLTDLKLRARMFSGTTCNANYRQHDISINNNANLSSADLTVDVRNHTLVNIAQASYFNFNFKNNVIKDLDINVNSLTSVNYSRLSSQADFTWRTTTGPYYITATFDLSSSQLLESFNINTNINGGVNTQLSSYNGDPTYSFITYLSTTPQVYEYPIPEYNSFIILREDVPFNEDTIDNFRLLDFANLKSSNVNFYDQSTTFLNSLNFTRLNSSISHLLTTTEILVGYLEGVYPKIRQYLFNGDSIPVERMFDILTNIVGMSHSNQSAVDYPYIVTNKNTLFGYQHTLITEPISGRRQPWTLYRPITAYLSINPNFGINKNTTYSWPISVLNNVSRMAFYQGPFASGPMPYTLIHPRYAITADHWNFGQTFPYSTAFFDTNTNTRTNVTVVTAAKIAATDIRIVKLQTPLPLSSFPGMYLLPYTLYTSNTATKIPPFMPSFVFSQDYDITPATVRVRLDSTAYDVEQTLGDNIGARLSKKSIRVGDSGHPSFTFVNNKPVLLGTFTTGGGGDSPSGKGIYELIQSKIDELEGQPTQLNIITQADLDIYDDYTVDIT